jgi:hypothetical protein
MKVKQIVGEAGQGGPSNQGAQGFGNPNTKYTVAPDNGTATPAGQEKMITLVPVGAPTGNGTQPVQGQITVQANAVDLTDPNNPVIDPKALQGNQQPQTQQPNALANKTVSVGLGEEPNEDVLAGGSGLETKPDRLNTFSISLQGDRPAALMGGRGPQPITSSPKWPTLTPQIEAKLKTQSFDVVYLKVNGKLIPAASGGGMLYVGSQDYPSLTSGTAQTNQPLQQEEQGDSPLSRIAHLAGIK